MCVHQFLFWFECNDEWTHFNKTFIDTFAHSPLCHFFFFFFFFWVCVCVCVCVCFFVGMHYDLFFSLVVRKKSWLHVVS